jgi:transposase
MFGQDVSPVQVAHRLRVSTKSAYQWRRRWRAGGDAALASKGAGGPVGWLSAGQVARLRAALEGGPAAWGQDEDQRWTLARVAALIGRLFHVRYTLRGASCLLHRLGYGPQVPIPRTGPPSSTASSPRPGSPSNPNRPSMPQQATVVRPRMQRAEDLLGSGKMR